MPWYPIINMREVKYGASSATTVLTGVKRALLNWNEELRVSRGGDSDVPDDVFHVGGNPQIAIETESYAELVTILKTARTKQVLLLRFYDSAGAKKQQFDAVKFAVPSPSEMPPKEAGDVPVHTVLAHLVKRNDTDTWADVIGDVEVDA